MNERMDDLLVKYMLSEATSDEQEQVQQWLAADSANEAYYQQLNVIWEKSRDLELHGAVVSEEAAWARFQQRVQPVRGKAPVIPIRKRNTMQWSVAVIVTAVIAAGAWMLYSTLGSRSVQLLAGNHVITEQLPDGSIVTLNREAVISYTKAFGSSVREVKLEGEAFFDIASDKNRPFMLTTGEGVAIKVLGTSFNVKNTAAATEVIVETGMVEVSRGRSMVRVKQQEKVTVTGNGIGLQKQANKSVLYNYYRTHSFVCNATSLSELVAVLNEAYDTEVVIGNERLRQLRLTTVFREASLDSIVNIVCQTLQIRSRKSNNRIILE